MRFFTGICAFSVFISLVICNPAKPVITNIIPGSGLTDSGFWKDNQLFYVLSVPRQLCSYHIDVKKSYCATIGKSGYLSFAVPVEGHLDKFVVGCGNVIFLVTWDGKHTDLNPHYEHLLTVEANIQGNRLNYGGVDPSGRLWFGTLNEIDGKYSKMKASVYSIDAAKNVIQRISQVGLSSGFVWNIHTPHHQTFYFDDSLERVIANYTYDPILGTVLDRKIVLDLTAKNVNLKGLAGRLAIDTRGALWVPLYGGGKVVEVFPATQKVGRTIDIGASRVGACLFGGPNLDILYVFTIGYGYEVKETAPTGDHGGSIFEVKGLKANGVNVKGWATVPYKLAMPSLEKKNNPHPKKSVAVIKKDPRRPGEHSRYK